MIFTTTLPRESSIEIHPTRVFPTIRLGDTGPVDSATIERHFLSISDTHVRGLAMQCVVALRKQIELAAFPSFMSLAVEAAQADGIPAAQWLEQKLADIRAETEMTKIEHARLETRRKVRADRLQPLQSAVSARMTAANVELQTLVERVQAASRAPLMRPQNPYQRLVDAGLSAEQIKVLGAENVVARQATELEAVKFRIPLLTVEIAKYQAFSADRTCNPDHLQGLDGFDSLIRAAQNIVEEVA